MSDEPKRRRTRVRSENRGGRDERGREETSAPVVEARRRGGPRATRARVRATRAKGLHATSGRDPGARASSRRRRACVSRDRDPSLTHLDDERGARGGGLAGGDARHGGDDAKGGNGGGHRCWVCVRRERAVWSAYGGAPTRERHPKTSAGQSRFSTSHASETEDNQRHECGSRTSPSEKMLRLNTRTRKKISIRVFAKRDNCHHGHPEVTNYSPFGGFTDGLELVSFRERRRTRFSRRRTFFFSSRRERRERLSRLERTNARASRG